MTAPFSHTFRVGWEHLDANGHMKNTAYLDLSVDLRFMYFETRGFSVREFERLRIGPVVLRDEVDYRREFRLLDSVTVTLALAGISADGSRFRLCNELYREDGALAARVTSTGGWLDLNARKLILPPAEILNALTALARTEDFTELPSSLR